MESDSYRVRKNYNLMRQQQDNMADWVKLRGLRMVDVTCFPVGKAPYVEQHVADTSTLPETVRMSLERGLCRMAVYPWGDQWCLAQLGKEPRFYPNKEAAEMVAIHSAGR